MALCEFKTDRHPDTDIQRDVTVEWRSKYMGLVDKLGELGTAVEVVRVLEQDQDIQPHRFVRGASHTFIFPPQLGVVLEVTPEVVDSTPGYTLKREAWSVEYDETLVTGKIAIRYDDADSRIQFSVEDRMGEQGVSELPDEAIAAIREVIPTFA